MLSHDFPFDTVQMPLNCLDATFRSFEQQVLPEAQKRGIAAAGHEEHGRQRRDGDARRGHAGRGAALRDEPAGGDHDQRHGLDGRAAAEPGDRPRISADDAAGDAALRDQAKPYAADGRFELFKTTKKYDGDVGRQQHHFPTAEELPA